MAKAKTGVLRTENSAELLSYIINETPILRENLDLPVQGQSIAPIGRIIMNDQRYKNAFINTVNLIGLTIMKRNGWENPWKFTTRGQLRFGQQIREIINDLCHVYDYNENATDVDRFLDNVVPDVLSYMHEVNFQKFYQTTTSDDQMAMAFEQGDLFGFIEDCIGMLYESLQYDTYIVDKYMLCRRILDGTMTPYYISDFASKTTREIVAEMKAVSNKMSFRSPNYNPAGLRRATAPSDQITIINTDFEAELTTQVLATSYYRDEAELKTNLVLIDGFANHDTARLTELLGSAFVNFTSDDLTALAKVPAVNISKEFFMDYDYVLNTEGDETKRTDFYNPSTLKNNHFLHVWRCFSTSPFENGVVFTQDAGAVSSVTVSPATATLFKGMSLQMSATVATTGFVNQSVTWSVDSTSAGKGVSIDPVTGLLTVASTSTMTDSSTITVTATSVYDTSKTGTATITMSVPA